MLAGTAAHTGFPFQIPAIKSILISLHREGVHKGTLHSACKCSITLNHNMAIILITEGTAAIGGAESISKGSYSEDKTDNGKNTIRIAKVSFDNLTKWKEKGEGRTPEKQGLGHYTWLVPSRAQGRTVSSRPVCSALFCT